MDPILLRPANLDDRSFALNVSEACMRVYAEQTWGAWNGQADFEPATDQIIQWLGADVGLMGVEHHDTFWWLDKLYILPEYQCRGIGGVLIERLQKAARQAGISVRLSVLQVNPARRFYERHGFVLTQTIEPRQYMEWSPETENRNVYHSD